VISGTLPPLINIPDLARYAKRPSSVHPMVIGLFVSKPLCIILGIVTTAAGNQLFDKPFWNQWDFYNAILDHHWNAGSRTAVFFLALTQCYATMCTNITSNSIPVGCDLTGLFPRYFTIRRGQILVSILAFACVPWKLVYSAASFLTFLGSYVCMITPIAACEIIDYWVLRKGNIHVHSLYKASSVSPYYYWHGVNLRAYAAWVSGVVIAISGIAGLLNPGSVPQTAVNLYNNSELSLLSEIVVY
jgi:NCS1 family nucleobase:cation symporter-1